MGARGSAATGAGGSASADGREAAVWRLAPAVGCRRCRRRGGSSDLVSRSREGRRLAWRVWSSGSSGRRGLVYAADGVDLISEAVDALALPRRLDWRGTGDCQQRSPREAGSYRGGVWRWAERTLDDGGRSPVAPRF
ncbi:splicing factor PWI domain-containing protein [Iris pallida]|uniref:Splicing factor PWI domain-containing protein n=1 Tax=Iris pallida TaxID=29817 RepID=A0AAX6FWW6_IRIPA|nr:splicing factor PWI domain-containing protein [Iris pallida]